MKSIASELAYFLRGRARQNLKLLLTYCAFLIGLILIYATIFRVLMLHLEGREFTMIAGIYWTITVMTTLGFGDITFHTDLGYIFATLVTVSGVIFLLIILPFGMVSLFIAPWIEDRLRHAHRRDLPEDTSGHVVVFGVDPVTQSFMRRLKARHIPFVAVTGDLQQAQLLAEETGFKVVYGSPTEPKILDGLRIAAARQVIANLSDPENTNICLAVRARCNTPVTAIVDDPEHVGLMRLAGASQTIPLKKILGNYLATRSTTCGVQAHVLDTFGALLIAEIAVHGTPFVGQTLAQAQIRQRTGLAVIGIWNRGRFSLPQAETILDDKDLMLLAGTRQQLDAMEELTGEQPAEDLVFILGHGRIGCAAAHFLDKRPVPFILVDREINPNCEDHIPVIGDATTPQILRQLRVNEARGVIITTNDDSTNVFLTLNSRHLNPNIRIVARANHEENVEQLYSAGADFVVSNASVGASILSNAIERKETIFLTEGIGIFLRPLPPGLDGKTILESRLRPQTGCSIVAMIPNERGHIIVSPAPETTLTTKMDLLFIGTPAQEETFDRLYPRPASS